MSGSVSRRFYVDGSSLVPSALIQCGQTANDSIIIQCNGLRTPIRQQDPRPIVLSEARGKWFRFWFKFQTYWTCCARGRPIIVEWERDARHSAGLSLVRDNGIHHRRGYTERVHIHPNEIAIKMQTKTAARCRIEFTTKLCRDGRETNGGANGARIQFVPEATGGGNTPKVLMH
ncbi:hypothetical protein EVAR_39698_1 [Eumeta japonica]|uniref:Uncharacterized protein n=1 Tax=Eumeta variegata TaxID=151549 RepID=A0A4C1W5H7_EUMVA|nr:hypothetical protein EVAR_39698_1 [Eumeta japonica]